MNALRLDGRHVVVTGASSGIGAAAARIAAGLGARVSLIARRRDRLVEVAGGIEGGAGVFPADVSDRAALEAALAAAEAESGPIEGFVANAGHEGPTARVEDYPDEAMQALFATHYWSLFWALKWLLPGMIQRGRGSIVATASITAVRGLPMTCGYNAAKHAMLGLVRSAAGEVARRGVRVNAVLPGVTRTDLLEGLADDLTGGHAEAGLQSLAGIAPIARLARADEAASPIAFLLTDAASYVTGAGWQVDGGYLDSVAPAA